MVYIFEYTFEKVYSMSSRCVLMSYASTVKLPMLHRVCFCLQDAYIYLRVAQKKACILKTLSAGLLVWIRPNPRDFVLSFLFSKELDYSLGNVCLDMTFQV